MIMSNAQLLGFPELPEFVSQFDPSALVESLPSAGGAHLSTPVVQVAIIRSATASAFELSSMLRKENGVRVLGESSETEQNLASSCAHADLLFLDVVAAETWLRRHGSDRTRLPIIVFGNDPGYASRAFELDAVDFLVAPFSRERIHRAIKKAQKELFLRVAQQLLSADAQAARFRRQSGHLVVKNEGRLIFLNLDDIDWIEAAANYVHINVGKECYVMRESIGMLSERLDPYRFVRIHRSLIVPAQKIRELHPCNNGEYIAILSNGKKLSCSRGFRDQLRTLISDCL